MRQCEAPADEMVVTRGERVVRVWRKAGGGGGGGEWFLQSSVAYKNRVVDAFAVSSGMRFCHIMVRYISVYLLTLYKEITYISGQRIFKEC